MKNNRNIWSNDTDDTYLYLNDENGDDEEDPVHEKESSRHRSDADAQYFDYADDEDDGQVSVYDEEENTWSDRRQERIRKKELKARKRKEAKEKRRPQTGKNREIMIVMYAFIIAFAAMIGYLVYFNAVESSTIILYAGNVHLAKLQEQTSRGSILAADGTVLAETIIDDDGEETRSYPFAEVFAHVVGTSQINESGLESSNDDILQLSNASLLTTIVSLLKNEKLPGDDVVTTLDVDLQQAAYDALGDNDGAVIVLEPDTGRVLAMVSKPDYDPNTLAEDYEEILADEDSKVLLNQATQGLFTPGSIFKIVTALEYIRENTDYAAYSFTCNGSISLTNGLGNTQTLSCYHGNSHGTLSLLDSFAKSCNTSFANIGTTLDIESFCALAESLLFNSELPTSIYHTSSSFSLDTDASEWLVGATAIGQGYTTMTPLHAAMIVSAIANDGVLMEPYLVDSVVSADGTVVSENEPVTYGSLMTVEEAQLLTDMMEEVVSSGTGTKLSDLGIAVAGKTGTAEVDEDQDNAWFIGFAPADDPEIVICVLVENATASSSSVAVPIARTILEAYFD